MNCNSFMNVLDLHNEGRLSPRRAKAAQAHLDSCAACRKLAAPVAGASTTRAPEALKAKLRAAVRTAPAAVRGTTLPLWPREARGIALAAAALALVGLLIASTGAPSQSGGNIAAVEEP